MSSRKQSAKNQAPAPRRIRCVIYTRKSTEEGLDQDFNSLDAQRDAAEAFILSQRREGWIALPERYDDGGFSGANMDRPALIRLLQAVERGELDCVVVYKVDRLSRSLLDFTRILVRVDTLLGIVAGMARRTRHRPKSLTFCATFTVEFLRVAPCARPDGCMGSGG